MADKVTIYVVQSDDGDFPCNEMVTLDREAAEAKVREIVRAAKPDDYLTVDIQVWTGEEEMDSILAHQQMGIEGDIDWGDEDDDEEVTQLPLEG